MVVICVGVHSQAGKTMSLLNRPAEDTPLQEKLEILADRINIVFRCFLNCAEIAKFGMTAAGLILVSLIVKLGIYVCKYVCFQFVTCARPWLATP